MGNNFLETKAAEVMESRKRKAAAQAELDKLASDQKRVERELIALMEEKDIKSFKHKKFGTITSAAKIFGKITDFDKAHQFFEEEGTDKQLFNLKVESGRLNEFVRKLLDKGKTLPEGIDFSLTQYISVRKV